MKTLFFSAPSKVNVSVELPALEETGEGEVDSGATSAMSILTEPYLGRPQLTGMRVRSKLLGAGLDERRELTHLLLYEYLCPGNI